MLTLAGRLFGRWANWPGRRSTTGTGDTRLGDAVRRHAVLAWAAQHRDAEHAVLAWAAQHVNTTAEQAHARPLAGTTPGDCRGS